MARSLIARVARSYITGPHLADAMRACVVLHRQGFLSTICFWNAGGDKPQQIAQQYLSAVDAAGAESCGCVVSVKAAPLKFSRTLFVDIARRARSHAVTLHFDSQAQTTVDDTLQLARELTQEHTDIGCTLPGRWRRSVTDALYAADTGFRVRVVKGQWADSRGPEIDASKGFMNVIDKLAGRARHVSVATHDPALARAALTRLRRSATACELELLLGLPMRHMLNIAAAHAVPVRLYLPYGRAWLPYAIDCMRQNPRIAWWVLRDLTTSLRLDANALRHPRLPYRP